ncbi:MAG: (d)CMP kinase [Tissierellia bacterium]|nr:(d)CMP kinase [Tissierellia bacterium]
MIIALDGPSGAGKSTIAKLLASKLNYEYLDTGAMYRAVTKYILDNKIDIYDKNLLISSLKNIRLDFNKSHIYLNGVDVENTIRSETITKEVSEVSSIKEIREFLVEMQRNIAKNKSIILDGRDIGTVVFPNADYKFFIVADVKIRAKRRFDQYKSDQTLEQIEASILKRDQYDSNRKISPLKKAKDAIIIDTSNLTIDETIEKIYNYIRG